MSKWTIKQFLLDKLFLLITATIAGIVLLGLVFFLRSHIFLKKEWVFFILESILYALIILVIAVTSTILKRHQQRAIPLLMLLLIIGFTISVFFLIFYLDVLPLPTYLLPYIIGATFLGAASLQFFNYLIKLWQKRKEI